MAESSGIKVLKTPVRAPKANAICERFMGTLKRECLDYMLILSGTQLHRLVREFVDFYNRARPHQGIKQRIPTPYPLAYSPPVGEIIATPALDGLHHDYSRPVYLH